jgi:WD40 repeat protein
VLFDQGRTLRTLSLPRGLTEAVLQSPSSNFTNFAQFSPDGSVILTAGAAEGRVQLWHAPTATCRAHEIRQFVSSERSTPNCGAFAPDGSFVVVGTRDKQVLVWPVPDAKEIDRQYSAELTLVEQVVEGSAGQVRIWAELPNPDGRLRAGGTATLVIYPDR